MTYVQWECGETYAYIVTSYTHLSYNAHVVTNRQSALKAQYLHAHTNTDKKRSSKRHSVLGISSIKCVLTSDFGPYGFKRQGLESQTST